MSLYRDQGVVLRTIKLGETDRIVTILTQGHGKIRAVAKGIRKPGSRFGARVQYIVQDAPRCLTHAVSMLEATDQVAQDREANAALYRMLVGALRTLATDPSPLVSAAFFWKLLSLEGFHPLLDACARCGNEDGPFTVFDVEEGGVLCERCGRFGGRRLQPDTLVLVQRILGGDLRGALAESPSATTTDVERLALFALEHHLERRLRSAALL